MDKKDYWSEVSENGRLYQMGEQSHRIYLLDLLKRNNVESILDVGCGTGPIYQLIKESDKYGFGYKGVDPSIYMINSCKKNFPEADWQVEDAVNLIELYNSWDCVLLMHSLDYVVDFDKAIKEAARVARKYVLIVLWQTVDFVYGSKSRLNQSYNPDDEYDWGLARLQHFSWNDLSESFTKNSLIVEEINNGICVNKEGKHNILMLLKKV